MQHVRAWVCSSGPVPRLLVQGLVPILLLLLLLLVWGSGCTPPGNVVEEDRELQLDFADPELRRVADLQDRLQVDSLLSYLRSSRAEVRYLSARAFGSLKGDSTVVEPLAHLLDDPILDVRTMAAYALGQQGHATALAPLTAAFERYDTSGFFNSLHRTILEAVGKVGDTATVRQLATIDTYLPTDTALLTGQALGLYRLALRDVTLPLGTARMVAWVGDEQLPMLPRLYAAHYLGRAKITLDSFRTDLLSAYDKLGTVRIATEAIASASPAGGGAAGAGFGESPDPAAASARQAERAQRLEAMIALARALGKTQDTLLAQAIPGLYTNSRDVRLRVELLRAAGKYNLPASRRLLLRAVRDTSDWIARTAAEQLIAVGSPQAATSYWALARDSVVRAARPAMYAAALRHLPSYYGEYRQYINAELRRQLDMSTTSKADEYFKADILRTMAEWPWNYRYLMERSLAPVSRVEQTAAAEAVDQIAQRPDIVDYMRASFPAFKREYADYFRRVYAGDDASLQAVLASTIAIPHLYFRTEFDNDFGFLAAAQGRLKHPQHIETYYAIERARAALSPEHEARIEPPLHNHAVNWDIYRSLQPGLEVAIATPRGEIIVDLFEREAPATTVNFVQLVRTGFYNEKVFHRVVPAFVTQGGDPGGDGYGSLDYTLRTETPPLYYDGAGYLGMASAGPHTEDVQFFFTHNATPHLDGRYTIFGRVVSGMDAVLALRRGDAMRMRLQ